VRRTVLIAVVLVATLGVASPATAITYGVPDGDAHPNVGGLIAPQAYSDGTWLYCSGTLIAPRIFLTAAHCGDAAVERVRVSFDTAYVDGKSKVYAGTFYASPAFSSNQDDPNDIAVVVFDKEVKGITPARLPEADSLSDLPGDQQFTSVGYGAYAFVRGQFLYNDVRMVATGTLFTINSAWLRISMNPALGDGGTCYGDSGGPNFLGTTDVIAATTITGDAACRATNVTYRLDTLSARAFLDDYVTLP
jgi:secreted trypsin-like serine protease